MNNTISIILEMENAALSQKSRFGRVFNQIIEQTNQLFDLKKNKSDFPELGFLQSIKSPLELIVTYNESQKNETYMGLIEEAIDKQSKGNISLKFVQAPELTYFDLKNFGASFATSDFIFLLDSDIIPQKNWLVTLLSSFANKEIGIVASNVYIEHHSLYTKSYALIKFHFEEKESKIVVAYDTAHGNSIAFRKEVFEKNQFPPNGTSYKLAFRAFINKLKTNGVQVYVNTGAQVEHPAPLPKNFFKRAFFHGRDEAMLRQDNQISETALKEFHPYKTFFGRSEFTLFYKKIQRSFQNFKKVNLRLWELPFAFGIIGVYYLAASVGYLTTFLFPKHLRSEKFSYLSMIE